MFQGLLSFGWFMFSVIKIDMLPFAYMQNIAAMQQQLSQHVTNDTQSPKSKE